MILSIIAVVLAILVAFAMWYWATTRASMHPPSRNPPP